MKRYFQYKYETEINTIYLGETRKLLNGTVDIRSEINENITQYIERKKLLSWGVKLTIIISSKNGTILYPMIYDEEEIIIRSINHIQVARDNYNLLSQGMNIEIDVQINHNSFLSNMLLTFYIVIFFLMSFIYFRRIYRTEKIRNNMNHMRLDELLRKEKEYNERLKDLRSQKNRLTSELFKIKNDFNELKLGKDFNEEEMLNEIIRLEEIIKNNTILQKKHEEETEHLKEKIESLNNFTRNAKNIRTEYKRLGSIYKNITINDRSVRGFMNLTNDLRIKSEKIIHDLNGSPDIVVVKRKIFNGKNGEPVLEAIFGHKGRLYFRNGNRNKIEILAIGTKNTQKKDMEYLRKL